MKIDWEVKNGQKLIFSNIKVKNVTLTFVQGHSMPNRFQGLHTGYFWARSHNSTVNSVRDIVKNEYFPNCFVNTVTLIKGEGHPMSYHFEGLSTGYLLDNFHNSAVNSVWDIANINVCHGRPDEQTDRQM